jgi:hypothetical protein
MLNTVEEVAISIFFTWQTNASYDIEQMRGRAQCDPYEAFKASKFLGVGINYLNDDCKPF